MRIIMKDNAGKLLEVEWKVGSPSPFKGAHYNAVYVVGEVIADGVELQYIGVTFTNLPTVNASIGRYFGDFAKFIAGNLP